MKSLGHGTNLAGGKSGWKRRKVRVSEGVSVVASQTAIQFQEKLDKSVYESLSQNYSSEESRISQEHARLSTPAVMNGRERCKQSPLAQATMRISECNFQALGHLNSLSVLSSWRAEKHILMATMVFSTRQCPLQS